MDFKEEFKVLIFKFIVFIVLVGMLYVGTWLLTRLPDIDPNKKLILLEIDFWGIATLITLFFLTAIGDIVHLYRKKHQRVESSSDLNRKSESSLVTENQREREREL
ncbi:MAG: hypothetical protein KAX39_02765 [candidate division Zixibacteria bacterium]|nr:hypothetical protein [candidate division Zixibacteria bacterium]